MLKPDTGYRFRNWDETLERRRRDGADVRRGTLQEPRTRGRRVALVTSSKIADAVLQAAGIQNLFEVIVDGNVAAAKKLAGKPSSDTYEEATRMLGTLPEQAVVIEDAISGVQAGRTGGFGLVIGVARSDDPEVLRQNGADVVVRDLAELSLV